MTTATVQDIVDGLNAVKGQDTLESTLLTRKLVRELYKKLGEPQADDFPDAYKHASCFSKMPGYSTYISTITPKHMRAHNCAPVDYRIKRPSVTKERIINDYRRDEWHITVHAFNVLCSKYIRHPRYPQIAVQFYVSRDTARYAYALVEE